MQEESAYYPLTSFFTWMINYRNDALKHPLLSVWGMSYKRGKNS